MPHLKPRANILLSIGETEFRGESQLFLLLKDEENSRYILGSILYHNAPYQAIPGPTLQSTAAQKLNHLIEYIVDDCSINTASFDDLFYNSVDDESEEEIEDGKSIISKWIEVGNGVETNKNLGPERISVSGTRGTIMVSLSDYKIQIFDGEDDGEDSDEDEDEDEMELED